MIHCGFIGILGLPNAGKSTFLNEVLGEKVSIISSKPQTTRQSFTGLVSTDDYQLIFLDAPGLVESKPGLFEFLAVEFTKVVERSEHLMVLISFEQKATESLQILLEKVKNSGKPYRVLFTKADLEESEVVKGLKVDFDKEGIVWMDFSVKKKDRSDINAYLKTMAETLPKEHHPLYDPDMISLDRTRDIVAEFIREQCFVQLEKELPYGLGVVIKSFKREKGMQHILANILIEKENHKAILIGKAGSRLKKIGQESRKKIEALLGEKVFLGLHVAYKKNWMKNKSIMKEVGYHHDK